MVSLLPSLLMTMCLLLYLRLLLPLVLLLSYYLRGGGIEHGAPDRAADPVRPVANVRVHCMYCVAALLSPPTLLCAARHTTTMWHSSLQHSNASRRRSRKTLTSTPGVITQPQVRSCNGMLQRTPSESSEISPFLKRTTLGFSNVRIPPLETAKAAPEAALFPSNVTDFLNLRGFGGHEAAGERGGG